MALDKITYKDWWKINGIRGRLFWNLVALFVLAASWTGFNLLINQRVEQSLTRSNEVLHPVALQLEQAKESGIEVLYQSSLLMQENSSETKAHIIDEVLPRFSGAREQLLLSDWTTSIQNITSSSLQQLGQEMSQYRDYVVKIVNAPSPGDQTNTYQQAENLQSPLFGTIDSMHAELLSTIASQEEYISNMLDLLFLGNIAGMALLTLLIILILFQLLEKLNTHFLTLQKTTVTLSEGNIPEELPLLSDERRAIHQHLNSFFANLVKMQDFAERVGNGEFDHAISVFDNKGQLGNSLNDMKQSLNEVAQADVQRLWVNEGFARFGDILRKHNNINELGDDLIAQLVKYVNANQGAIYLKEERKGSKDEYMHALSCYAYHRKKFIELEIEWGEGLVGRSWQENDTIFLTEVPDDFINIRSGLGDASPRCVLIQPLNYNEETIGVLELASFEEFAPYQIDFIKKLAETIAATIISSFANQKTVVMLEEAQQMAEEMKAQEEEMRQNMEELQATQEEMRRTQVEVKTKESNLSGVINSTDDTIFAIDRQYRILVVNDILRKRFKNLGINLKTGDNVLELLPPNKRAHWKERYDRALQGEHYSKIEQSMSTEGSVWVETFHNPVFSNTGEVIGASIIGRDISNFMNVEQEAARKSAIIKSLIDYTDDTFFAIDRDFKIIVVNSALQKRFATAGIQLLEGDVIFDKLPEDQHEYWRNIYERGFKGETFSFDQERPVGDKTITVRVYVNPVTDDKGKVVGTSVNSHDITEMQDAIKAKTALEAEVEQLKKQLGQ